MEKLNIYQKLQEVRYDFTKIKLNKSGYNNFAKFSYFELQDFLQIATQKFKEIGITTLFSIIGDYAQLDLINNENPEERMSFGTPVDVAMKNALPIQDIGARHTYAKRYLYINALELVEHDIVDATIGKDTAEGNSKPITATQIKQIETMYADDQETLQKSLAKAKVQSVEQLNQDLAKKMIAFKMK